MKRKRHYPVKRAGGGVGQYNFETTSRGSHKREEGGDLGNKIAGNPLKLLVYTGAILALLFIIKLVLKWLA